MLKTASIKEIKKITEATGDLFGNKIAHAAAKSDNGKTASTASRSNSYTPSQRDKNQYKYQNKDIYFP